MLINLKIVLTVSAGRAAVEEQTLWGFCTWLERSLSHDRRPGGEEERRLVRQRQRAHRAQPERTQSVNLCASDHRAQHTGRATSKFEYEIPLRQRDTYFTRRCTRAVQTVIYM